MIALIVIAVLAAALLGSVLDAMFAHNQVAELSRDLAAARRLLRAAESVPRAQLRDVDTNQIARALERRRKINGGRR